MNIEVEYECDKCGETLEERKEIRDHVKECQPNWSNHGLEERPPLSSRYNRKVVG